MSWLHHFDLTITNRIVALPPSLAHFFLVITSLGDPIVTIAIGLAVAAQGAYQQNNRLILGGMTVWATLGIGSILKLIVARHRPLTDYAASLRLDTFSFPSGHTSGATIAYGLLAYIAWQLLPSPLNYIVSALLGLLILLVGVSRVYLGAHFPSDVVAGWLLGSLALLFIVFVLRPLA